MNGRSIRACAKTAIPWTSCKGQLRAKKRVLWQRSVDRAYAQHPYAGILVARHAEYLYRDNLAHTPENERRETEAFLQALDTLPVGVRRRWQGDAVYERALQEPAIQANTHLLKFGDSTSLQVCVPWGEHGVIHDCPVNHTGSYVDITMTVSEDEIHFDPWPFGLDAFEVGIHGRLLNRSHFPSESAYHAALRHAPFLRLSWRVVRD